VLFALGKCGCCYEAGGAGAGSGLKAMRRQSRSPSRSPSAELSLTLSGQGAEKYDWPAKDGKRPPVPTYRIIDEAGKTVASGTFEYG